MGFSKFLSRCFLAVVPVLFGASQLYAQSEVPILSGGMGILRETDGGATFFQPIITPVLAVPIGDRWLIETRADLRGFYSREDGTSGPYEGQFFSTLEYAQVDYNATSWLTITGGRFLTPFNMYNERLTPIWIQNLQDAPFIYSIGNSGTAANLGGMARGAGTIRPDLNFLYTVYFSAASNVSNFESERQFGGRWGVFLPQKRLEVGASYQRLLQGQHMNSEGAYVSWQPYRAPLDLKAEYAHAPDGQGYWIEAAYRLSQFGGAYSLLGRLAPVVRVEQFFRLQAEPGDGLPGRNAERVDFGLNYYLPHAVRLNASYARQLEHGANMNVWNLGITYRFLFPMPFWPKGGNG